MHHYFKCAVLILLSGSSSAFTASSYWQCVTEDSANKVWSARSFYQKAALNIAFASCKKESQNPVSCKTSASSCEGFNQGYSLRPMWQCTALDHEAQAWQSNFYAERYDAALGAKLFCKEKSGVPDTCYINLVTCMNMNHGEPL